MNCADTDLKLGLAVAESNYQHLLWVVSTNMSSSLWSCHLQEMTKMSTTLYLLPKMKGSSMYYFKQSWVFSYRLVCNCSVAANTEQNIISFSMCCITRTQLWCILLTQSGQMTKTSSSCPGPPSIRSTDTKGPFVCTYHELMLHLILSRCPYLEQSEIDPLSVKTLNGSLWAVCGVCLMPTICWKFWSGCREEKLPQKHQ